MNAAPALPVEPRAYHHFYRTPRLRWWRPVLGILGVLAAFFLATLVASAVALAIDVAGGRQGVSDIQGGGLKVTPAIFIANNVSLALLIPISMLFQWWVFRQRPRWLSSVVGGVRWGWLGRCLALTAPVYVLSQLLTWLLGGVEDLRVGPDTLVMILGILLTTPFQSAGEEYGMRGFLNRAVGSWFRSERAAFVFGLLASSALFVVAHGAGDVWLNLWYGFFGVISAWLVYRTGGLEASIALHVVNNLVAMVTLPFTDFSKIFDRQAGAGGPEILFGLPALLIAVGLIEWSARRRGIVLRTAPGSGYPGPR